MSRVLSAVLLLLVMTVAWAQGTAPDLRTPQAAAQAYLEACQRWDVKAAAGVSTVPRCVTSAARRAAGCGSEPELALQESMCLPLFKHMQYVPGEPAVTGDECRLPVVATYTVPQTLVLRKQADGTWKVDVHESVLSTTGQAEAMFARGGDQEEVADCLTNLKQIAMAVLCYAQDHDETLPHADKWCDEIKPYLSDEAVLKCPSAPDLVCGYAFNAALSGQRLAKVEKPAETIVVFESASGVKNASGDPAALPHPNRHADGNCAAYVDGHAKWQKDEKGATAAGK